MFNYLTPYIQSEHPLYRLELQRIRWLAAHRSLWNGTIKVGVIVTLIGLGLWGMGVFGTVNSFGMNLLLSRSGDTVAVGLVCSILANVLLDFACLIVTVNSFASDVTAGRWDLLRMTDLTSSQILDAKHTAAQLRVWRLMVAIVTSRLLVVVLGTLTILMNINLHGMESSEYVLLLTLVIFAVIYLMEPIWRSRSLTALGLAISSRVRNLISISLSAIGAVFIVWLSQAVIVGLVIYIMTLFVRDMIDGVDFYWVVFIFCLLMSGIVYGYYRLIRNISLGYVLRRMDKLVP